jgi:O-antigen/teichoic acid export membrane protein
MSLFLALKSDKYKRWSNLILAFVLGQGALQAINLVSGFFLLRWLSVDEYAKYTLAFAFQSTAQMFVEFGFSGAIIALVGKNASNKSIIGGYIKAGKFFRLRSFIIIALVCIIVFPMLALKHDWAYYEIALVLIAILSNLYFSGLVSYYKPVLQIHNKIKQIYTVDVSIGIARFCVLFLFSLLLSISGYLAVLINSVQTFITGAFIKRKASLYVEEPKEAEIAKRKEMLRYITPIIPGIVFAAFQSQIALFIISIFGSNSSIAELGALSRLGQIFLILNTSTGMLVAPYIAKQDFNNLRSKFINIILLALLLCFIIVSFAYMGIDVFIWFLGNNYTHLQYEVLLTIFNSCILFLNGLIWSMNSSRKWLFNWMPMISIPGILLIQVLGAAFIDLSIVSNVLYLSLFTSFFTLLTRVNVAFWGFKKRIE